MSIDRREEVLARLFAILDDIEGRETCVRNRGILDNDKLPALILLDGDETTKTLSGGNTRGRTGLSVSLVTMTPQIFVVLKLKKPANELVGQLVNTFRGRILNAIAADEQLKAIIGPNGGMTYDAMETDLKTGSPLEGEAQLNFSITVPCDPKA